MPQELKGKKIAILATQGVEEIELTDPRRALEEAGAATHLIAPEPDTVRAWDHTDWGAEFTVDVPLDQAKPEEYDALLLPGGVMNPDKLRLNEKAVRFAREMSDAGKPIAAICHAPWMLIEAGIAKGRTLTSYPSLQTDLRNAGAEWVDREVVTDRGLVTSRSPKDLEAFNRTMIEEFAGGEHRERMAA